MTTDLGEFSAFGTQFTASAVIAFLGHVLERWVPATANFPPTLKRAVYWAIAAGSAIGVHEHFTPATGTLVVTGLSLAGIVHASWHWIQSVALQEFVHGATNRPAPPKGIANPMGTGQQAAKP